MNKTHAAIAVLSLAAITSTSSAETISSRCAKVDGVKVEHVSRLVEVDVRRLAGPDGKYQPDSLVKFFKAQPDNASGLLAVCAEIEAVKRITHPTAPVTLSEPDFWGLDKTTLRIAFDRRLASLR